MAIDGWPVWGALDWVAVIDSDAGVVRSCVIVAGRTVSGRYHVCNPLGKAIVSPVDHITLHCKNEAVSLSDTMKSVKAVVAPLEKSLGRQFKDLPSTGADVFVCVDFKRDLERKDDDQ